MSWGVALAKRVRRDIGMTLFHLSLLVETLPPKTKQRY